MSSLKLDADVNPKLKLSSHAYIGRYRYKVDPDRNETTVSQWWGLDSKLVSTWLDGHTMVLGAEFREDNRQHVHVDGDGGLQQVAVERQQLPAIAGGALRKDRQHVARAGIERDVRHW